MEKSELIEQLQSLLDHCQGMAADGDEIWERDAKALETAVKKFSSECAGNSAQEIIKAILEKEGLNQQQLADKVGTIRQNVSQMLTRGAGMRYSSFQKMVRALGYEIIARKD